AARAAAHRVRSRATGEPTGAPRGAGTAGEKTASTERGGAASGRPVEWQPFRRDECWGQARNDQRNDLVFARVGDVQPAAARPVYGVRDARRRAEYFGTLVAQVANDTVGADRTDVSAVIVGDENRQLAAGFRHDRDTRRSGERRLQRRAIVAGVLPIAVA